jgi:hypothetical protein
MTNFGKSSSNRQCQQRGAIEEGAQPIKQKMETRMIVG